MPTGDHYLLEQLERQRLEKCCEEFNGHQQVCATAPLPLPIRIKLLDPSRTTIPSQSCKGDAGYDLYAAESGYILPGQRALVSTQIAVSIPQGYYGRIAPRSGLAVKKGVDVLAGVIDSGYHGEIKVALINLDNRDAADGGIFQWTTGDRIAQLIIEKCHEVEFIQVDTLDETTRGRDGFGSSGA